MTRSLRRRIRDALRTPRAQDRCEAARSAVAIARELEGALAEAETWAGRTASLARASAARRDDSTAPRILH